jgi:hypothetical protein
MAKVWFSKYAVSLKCPWSRWEAMRKSQKPKLNRQQQNPVNTTRFQLNPLIQTERRKKQ